MPDVKNMIKVGFITPRSRSGEGHIAVSRKVDFAVSPNKKDTVGGRDTVHRAMIKSVLDFDPLIEMNWSAMLS